MVFDGHPTRVSTFYEVNPFHHPDNPQGRETAGYYGVASCDYAGVLPLHVGVRQWIGVNAYQDHLRVRLQYMDSEFHDVERPVGFGQPLSISCAPNGTFATVYYDDRIFVNARHFPGRLVEETTLDGKVIVAKFAADNHLWVVTEHGLWRSSAPVGPF
jgi:hypothetical protein